MTRLVAIASLLGLHAVACTPSQRGAAATTPATQTRAGSPEALFARGRELAARGDGNRAEQYLTLAVRAGYPEERAIALLVRVCIASSRLRAALDHAEPFLRRHPSAWQLRYLVAAIELALGHGPLAAQELRRIVAQRPETAQAHYLLGVIERDTLHDERATRASFETYLARDPGGPFSPEASAWLAEHPRSGEAEP